MNIVRFNFRMGDDPRKFPPKRNYGTDDDQIRIFLAKSATKNENQTFLKQIRRKAQSNSQCSVRSMMLRNKSQQTPPPANTATSVDSNLSNNSSSSSNPIVAGVDHLRNNIGKASYDNDDYDSTTPMTNAVAQQQLSSSSTASSPRKPTHRRGYSHGSYSALNMASKTNLPPPSSSIYLSSLGQATLNNSMEISFDDRRNASSSSHEQTGPMKKSTSTDDIDHQAHPANEETKLRIISQIEQKRRKIKKAIAEEQVKCNENVNEYLRLSGNAQVPQMERLKTVFEKKNQKSSQRIARYQKKLHSLDQQLENIKNGGIYHRHTRERLRDVGTNIKEGISGLSAGVFGGIRQGIHTAGETVITKPKEFFKRNTTDCSAEKSSVDQDQGSSTVFDPEFNIGSGADPRMLNSNSHSHSHSTKSDESSDMTSESGHLGINSQSNSAYHSSSPIGTKAVKRYYTDIDQLRSKIDERTQDCMRFSEEIQGLKQQLQREMEMFNTHLQDEKYRVERLEDQLNDLTELHQKEIENLKQTISDLEEKIQYQTEERHRDVHEMLESFQTRISRMEHQQHQHLQQLVNLDSLDNSKTRDMVLKLINVLLTVLQVVLLVVATVVNILAPFHQTRARIFTSVFAIILFTFVFQHYPELNLWTKKIIYENCVYVLNLIPFLRIITNDVVNNNDT